MLRGLSVDVEPGSASTTWTNELVRRPLPTSRFPTRSTAPRASIHEIPACRGLRSAAARRHVGGGSGEGAGEQVVDPIHIVGGGLAGSEAAWQAARAGVRVVIHEMRPVRATDAHVTDRLAELVCSNSFRSDDAENNAVGLLHEEMRRCGSLILRAADLNRVPAGGALAVDRHGFAEAVEAALAAEPLVEIRREEIAGLPPEDWDEVIVATGPLTSPALAEAVRALTGEDSLAFFDAIAPIVYRESIDMSKAWLQSRYDKGEGSDYIN